MAHNALVRNPVTNWTDGSQILVAEVLKFDANLCAAINAVDGGCYAPVSQAISIALSGLSLTGPLTIARGGSLVTGSASGITIPAGTAPKLSATHPGRTRLFATAFAEARVLPRYLWRIRRADGAMQSIAGTYVDEAVGTSSAQARMYLPIRAHQGATLSKITIGFSVPTPHASLPNTMPACRMMRIDTSGNATFLTSVAAGADANGFTYITRPTTAAGWYANGAAQTFTLTCDQNNVIDRTLYSYVLEVIEEQSDGYPFTLHVKVPCKFLSNGLGTLTALASQDGYNPSDGDRVLVTGQPDVSQNGIWIAHTGPWTRATDLQSAASFAQGFLVAVQQGNFYGGTTWQPASSATTWTPGNEPAGTDVWLNATGYLAGHASVPSAAHATGYWYTVTTAGTSAALAANEPAWPNSVGSTVTDNTVVWTCGGPTAMSLTFVTRQNGDTVPEASAIVAHGNIWQSTICEFDNITSLAWQ